ncbi:MAG: nucleotidyltransferase family protein [Acidobacteriota bacterium]
MKLAGLILAAGASRRMGAPKALLTLEGETFLDRLIRLLAAHCSPVLVVLGHQADEVRRGLARSAEAVFVVNADPERGQLSSLQCGLAAAPPESEGFMFTPVDYPGVRPSTVAALAAAFSTLRPLLAIPRCQGRRGHPVCCARELIPEFLALPADSSARAVIYRRLDEACYVDVDDAAIVEDVDDPEAYQRLLRAGTPR